MSKDTQGRRNDKRGVLSHYRSPTTEIRTSNDLKPFTPFVYGQRSQINCFSQHLWLV